MLDSLRTQAPDRASAERLWTSPAATIGIITAVGLAYFFAAQLGLALLTATERVAVFWPASGIATGTLLALGRWTRVPVAVAVLGASVAAALLSDRNVWAALAFGLCNAGEALLAAWLIERWFGASFNIDSLHRVLGLFAAAGVAAATAAVGASGAMKLFGPSTAASLDIWEVWFASDALGIVTVAPLLIGVAAAVRDAPSWRELLEGSLGVVAVTATIGSLLAILSGPWSLIAPASLLFPLLLWLGYRCRPVFAAAAVFTIAAAIVLTTTHEFGRYGDPAQPIAVRVIAAQIAMLGTAMAALALAALFAERRRYEATIVASEARLRSLLGALPAAIYTTDEAGHITYCNQAAVDLWGTRPELGKTHWSDVCRLRYLDGTPMPHDQRPTQMCLKHGRAIRDREALLERADGTRVPIIPCPAPFFDEHGALAGVVSMKIDISELKRAEAALNERNAQLELAGRAARVGSYTLDFATGIVQLSPGCAAIYGLPEGTVEMSHDEGRARVHQKDLARLDALFAQASKEQRYEFVAQFRIDRANDGQVRWIEARNLVSYEAGRPSRIVGISIDITERKQAEAVLKGSERRLAEALTAGRVIAFEWDAITGQSRRSANAALILGLEEVGGMQGSQHYNILGQVHPDDREGFQRRIRDLCPENPSYAMSFRYCHPDGRQLWLEETAQGEFDAMGRLLRVRGLTRDITDRRQAERALEERNMQLSLAGRAALVGSFAYDFDTEQMQISEGYAAIHGLPPGTRQMTCGMWKAGVHQEDVARYDELRRHVFHEQRAEYGAEYRIVRGTGEVRWIEARCFVTYRADGRPLRVVGVNIDVTDRKRAEDHQHMLVAELDHRVKNVLATVSAIASRTQDEDASGGDFVAALAGRIKSMAATHELLSRRHWKGIAMSELVRRELAPYATRTNTDINGPELTLSPEAGQAVSMVLHELTTNAAKHGALNASSGRVCVRWYPVTNGNADPRVCIEWRETGGPLVQTPKKSGYGMEVIRDLIPYELGGTVDLAFAPEGVRCDLDIPGAKPNGGNRLLQRHDQLAAGA
jgi:PAS domain S-box-containing protein